ncbi:MAG: MBL fold metallo-hydrolase [Acidobacteriales bacterium]|nr:MBL fold metallo-hydrolase [Terriglobales bacterium]
MAYIQFLGAAGTVTGSKHLINLSGDTSGRDCCQVLIDCGLFQGKKEWRERNWQPSPIPPREIEAVILTHAHLDHSGWIPRLVKEGFRGPIYATPPTIDLCGVLLPDSGHLQEEDAAFYNRKGSSKHKPALPLYTEEEAEQSLQHFRPVEYEKTVQLRPGFSFRFVRAAHILGSCLVEISIEQGDKQRALLFTGDIGRVRNHQVAPGKVVRSGPTEGRSADLMVMESTYGNRNHPTSDARPELARLIKETVARGGSVIVPAFAVERTQKLAFLLKDMMDDGEIPQLPVHVDSPMAIKAVNIFLKYSDEFSEEARELINKHGSPLTWQGFFFDTKVEDSKKINQSRFPMIVISSSGMATGGRVLHHLAQRLPDPKNLVLFIGFQAPGTRGFAIKNGAESIKIFGEQIPIRAQTATLEQFSDHADTPELLTWLRTFKKAPGVTYLVHGEAAASTQLQAAIHSDLGWKVEVAQWMQRVDL